MEENKLKLRQTYPLLLAYTNSCSPIMGRTRFQKMIFLLQIKLKEKELGFNFIPYYYGPYSKTRQVDIDNLIEEGLIEEKPTQDPSGKYMYRYEITEKGKTIADKLLTKSKYSTLKLNTPYRLLDRIKNDANHKSLDALLREVYMNHPEYAQFSRYEF